MFSSLFAQTQRTVVISWLAVMVFVVPLPPHSSLSFWCRDQPQLLPDKIMRSRNLTPAGLPGRLRNFYVGDALRIHVLTVRPHLDKTNNGRRTPEKDSRRPAGEFSAHSSKISRIRGAVILELLSVNQKGASRSYSQRAFIEKLVCSRLYAMCRSSALVIWSFGTAPTICSTTCPFLNSSNVGIP